jgi:hypothetical protein
VLPNVLSILALIIQVLALGFLIWYTILTKSISLAAQEQAEASQKPVIVLQCVPRTERTEQVMELPTGTFRRPHDLPSTTMVISSSRISERAQPSV